MHRLAPPLLGGNSQCHWLLLRRKRVVPALALVVLAGLGTLQSAAVAEPKKFLLGTDDSEQLLSGQWLRRIYGEAFKRLGLPLEVVVAPLSRLEALLERGEIDADAMRGPSYAARHPELIPVEIPRIRTYFAIYALKPIDDLQSLQDLSAGKLSGAYRRGVVGCQDTLEALLPKRRLTAVNNLDVGLRMMASRHADFYCDVSLGVSNYLPKPGQPPKPLKLFEIGRPFSNSIYLHPKHAGLATELAATFRQMEAEGLLAESGLEAKPPP